MKCLNNFKNVSIICSFNKKHYDSNWLWNIIINLQNIEKYEQIHKATIFKRLL